MDPRCWILLVKPSGSNILHDERTGPGVLTTSVKSFVVEVPGFGREWEKKERRGISYKDGPVSGQLTGTLV